MPRYSDERKAAALKKLLPPDNRPVPDVAKEEGIIAGYYNADRLAAIAAAKAVK